MSKNEINRVTVGTYELKRVYQRNMLIAMLLVIASTAVIIGSVTIANAFTGSDEINVVMADTVIIDFTMLPPPLIVKEVVTVAKTKKLDFESIISGIEAADDDELEIDPVLTSREDFKAYYDKLAGDNLDGEFGKQIIKDYIPPRDSFIAMEVFPEIIYRAQPKYPEIARKAGIEGSVAVQILIDLDGSVMDAEIVEGSGANAGFEEAALEAARKAKFTPAMQNKQPIRVWLTYTIEFKLK